MKNLYKALTFGLTIAKSYSLNIVWDNNTITSEAEHESFMNHMQTDPRFAEYLKVRDQIAEVAAEKGVFISPNHGIFGAHFAGFHFNENNLDENYYCFYDIKNTVTIEKNRAIKVPNTDLAIASLQLFQDISQKDLQMRFPILEPASTEEIKNPKNRFYALSCTLHGSNIANGCTELDTNYFHVVRCKPTSGDSSTQPQLIFEIDDQANSPIVFRTTSGDSCQPFVLITPEGTIKVVGTHNPAENSFSVENIAYPPTKNFIDNVID